MGTWCPARELGIQVLPQEVCWGTEVGTRSRGPAPRSSGVLARRWLQGSGRCGALPPLPTGGPWLLWPVPWKALLMPFPAAPGTRSIGPSRAPPGGLGDNLPLGLLGEPSAGPGVFRLCVTYGQRVSVREALQRPFFHEEHRSLESPLLARSFWKGLCCHSICVPPLPLVGRYSTGGARTAQWLGHHARRSTLQSQHPPNVPASLSVAQGTCPLRWD